MDNFSKRTFELTQTGIAPQLYGLPKIHKTGIPLRPIVSIRGSVTYGVAKVIAKVLKPLVGMLPHHILSTSDFVSKVRGYSPSMGVPLFLQCYCIVHLCTIDPALNIIKDLLEQDDTLCNRIVLSVQNIIELLGFCLHNTYFSFKNKFFEQVKGVAMGSLVSPIIANLYMEHFKRKPLGLSLIPQALIQVCG